LCRGSPTHATRGGGGNWGKSFLDVKEQKTFRIQNFNVRVYRSRNYVMSPGRKFEETALSDT
jgi:hypothetical protein